MYIDAFCEFLKKIVVLEQKLRFFVILLKNCCISSKKCDKTKATLVFDNVDQLVLEYGIFERVRRTLVPNSFKIPYSTTL